MQHEEIIEDFAKSRSLLNLELSNGFKNTLQVVLRLSCLVNGK